MQMMNKNGFSRCAEFYIGRLRKEGRYSTAHVYKNALFSFSKFCGTSNVSFRQITRERLRRYGQYLYDCGLKPNTISTYMRMLRSITIGEWKRGMPLMCPDCSVMSIRAWMSARKEPCLLPNFASSCMKTRRRSVCAVHNLLPP